MPKYVEPYPWLGALTAAGARRISAFSSHFGSHESLANQMHVLNRGRQMFTRDRVAPAMDPMRHSKDATEAGNARGVLSHSFVKERCRI
jgi:hypothetical protein